MKTIVKVPYMSCIVIIPYIWLWGRSYNTSGGYNAWKEMVHVHVCAFHVVMGSLLAEKPVILWHA